MTIQEPDIYAEAYGTDPEFYRFGRGLQSCGLFLGKRSMLLLSAESPLFRYLARPCPEVGGIPTVARTIREVAVPGLPR